MQSNTNLPVMQYRFRVEGTRHLVLEALMKSLIFTALFKPHELKDVYGMTAEHNPS